MKNWWGSYQAQSNSQRQMKQWRENSITKEELALLEERLEFFVPNFGKLFGMQESVIYILAWSLFITGLQLGSVTGWQDFLSLYLFEIMVTIITVVPIFFLAQLQRDALQEISPLQACLRLVATAFLVAIIAMFFALSVSSTLGWTNLSGREMVLMTTIHTINVTSFTSVFLIYYLH